MDFTKILPLETSLHIFRSFNGKDLCSFAQVSKIWNLVVSHNWLWINRCVVEFEVPAPKIEEKRKECGQSGDPFFWKKQFLSRIKSEKHFFGYYMHKLQEMNFFHNSSGGSMQNGFFKRSDIQRVLCYKISENSPDKFLFVILSLKDGRRAFVHADCMKASSFYSGNNWMFILDTRSNYELQYPPLDAHHREAVNEYIKYKDQVRVKRGSKKSAVRLEDFLVVLSRQQQTFWRCREVVLLRSGSVCLVLRKGPAVMSTAPQHCSIRLNSYREWNLWARCYLHASPSSPLSSSSSLLNPD